MIVESITIPVRTVKMRTGYIKGERNPIKMTVKPVCMRYGFLCGRDLDYAGLQSPILINMLSQKKGLHGKL